MTQSMIGLMGPSQQTTDEMMPFANLSTPANTDLFNQSNGSRRFSSQHDESNQHSKWNASSNDELYAIILIIHNKYNI